MEQQQQSRYEKLGKIGAGSYSKVYRCRCRETSALVVVKKTSVFDDYDYAENGLPYSCLREVSLFKALSVHPNITKLIDVYVKRRSGPADLTGPVKSVNLVFENMDMDLGEWLKRRVYEKRQTRLRRVERIRSHQADEGGATTNPVDDATVPDHLVRKCVQHILRGLAHCHARGVAHRDIKPQNILVRELNNGQDVFCKIADFGMGRCLPLDRDDRAYTDEVVTLWYRAPEVLSSHGCYSHSVDIWSVGCVLMELLLARPLFRGETEIMQLKEIFNLLGRPDEGFGHIERFDIRANKRARVEDRQKAVDVLAREFPSVNRVALDLASRMLALDPDSRITAAQALDHPFLAIS